MRNVSINSYTTCLSENDMNIYILKSSFGYIVSLRDRDFVRAEEICTKQSILSEISRISLELANRFYKDVVCKWESFFNDAERYNCNYIKWNGEPIFAFKNEDDALSYRSYIISTRVLKQLGESS